MADGCKSPKWEGNTSAEVKGRSAEQVWPLLEDFCNIHKWIPTIETCYQVEGVAGLIRFCAGTGASRNHADPEIKWAKEKLLMMDSDQRCLSYEVVDSNMGFKSYVAKLKVLPIVVSEDGDKSAARGGCKIEWSFVCDPVEGWTYEGLFAFIQSSLQFMANKMELACSPTHTHSCTHLN